MLIALLATVVLAAGWMAFLRPGAVESTTEQVAAPAKVATQASEAAAATDKASAATEAAADAVAGGTSATPAPAAAPTAKAKPTTPAAKAKSDAAPKAAAKADPQAALLREMDSGKVVVLLFWDKTGADDRAARDAVKDLDLRDGKVAVHVVRVKDVGRYESVTQGVNVTQSPTTIVISPEGTARTIAGLSDPSEVDQLVREALKKK
jgi:hypothetical protein